MNERSPGPAGATTVAARFPLLQGLLIGDPGLPSRTRWAVVALVATAIGALDILSGPLVQFPIAFVIPVAFGAGRSLALGWALALLAPVPRVVAWFFWSAPWPWWVMVVNAAANASVLVVVALLVRLAVGQRREIEVLRELAPICAYCKKVRTPSGEWERVERFVARRAPLDFSHTYCPDCVAEHLPEEAIPAAPDEHGPVAK